MSSESAVSSESALQRTVETAYAAMARGDRAVLLAQFDPRVVWDCYGPATLPWSGRFRGREGLTRYLDLRDQHVELESFTPTEVLNAAEAIVGLGTELLRSRRHHSACEVHWAHVFHFVGGQIVSVRELTDSATIVGLLTRS